jgi:hypothetical protein
VCEATTGGGVSGTASDLESGLMPSEPVLYSVLMAVLAFPQ